MNKTKSIYSGNKYMIIGKDKIPFKVFKFNPDVLKKVDEETCRINDTIFTISQYLSRKYQYVAAYDENVLVTAFRIPLWMGGEAFEKVADTIIENIFDRLIDLATQNTMTYIDSKKTLKI